ncbi:MAG: hypothetical protein R3B13_23430 [Polyangiaceae bacterium]
MTAPGSRQPESMRIRGGASSCFGLSTAGGSGEAGVLFVGLTALGLPPSPVAALGLLASGETALGLLGDEAELLALLVGLVPMPLMVLDAAVGVGTVAPLELDSCVGAVGEAFAVGVGAAGVAAALLGAGVAAADVAADGGAAPKAAVAVRDGAGFAAVSGLSDAGGLGAPPELGPSSRLVPSTTIGALQRLH